jgi:hypothetical protein
MGYIYPKPIWWGYLLLILLISWGLGPNFFFGLWRSHFDWPTAPFFSRNIGHSPNIDAYCLALLYGLYIWKFKFWQSMWYKSVLLWGTSWGTHWKIDGNTLMWTSKSPQTQKKKKWAIVKPFHWLHEIIIFTSVCHHSWPRLMEGKEGVWVYIFHPRRFLLVKLDNWLLFFNLFIFVKPS